MKTLLEHKTLCNMAVALDIIFSTVHEKILGNVWFSKNERKKKWRKIKKIFKVNKIFLYVTSNSFYLF